MENKSKQHIGECILFLIEEGLDEDAHYRGPWHDLDDGDLEQFLDSDYDNDLNLLNEIRGEIYKLLRKALEDRKTEAKKFPGI